MKRRHPGIALLALAFLTQAVLPGSGGFARAAATGLNGEFMFGVLPNIDVRFGAPHLPLSAGRDPMEGNYNSGVRVLTFPLTLDWYPLGNGFHFSGSLVFTHNTTMKLDTGSAASMALNEHTYSASDYGTVHGEAHLHRLAPYVGIGWGSTFGAEGSWGILSDVGVAFLGRTHVGLSATGPIASDPSPHGGIDEQDMSLSRFYPVISVSLFFRF